MVMIWRNDDINPNSSFALTDELYSIINERFPGVTLWSCVNVFSKYNGIGSLYREIPFKNNPVEWFYDVNQIMPLDWVDRYRDISNIVSHGLFHIDHAKVSRDAQEMSILSSCRLLDTDIFVPPFNSFNADTEDICNKNGINLVTPKEGWRSIDCSDFEQTHELWYMHSWRWTPQELRQKICQAQAV